MPPISGKVKRGHVCEKIIKYSRISNLYFKCKLEVFCPCCVVEYKISLYPAEKNDRVKTLKSKNFLIIDKLRIRIISPNKLTVKGPPKLAIINRNQNIESLGQLVSPPEFMRYLRECLRSYIILAP